jgi:sRNA-binding protein
MSFKTIVTLVCDGPSCTEHVEAATKRLAKIAARKAGWKPVKSAKALCPKHAAPKREKAPKAPRAKKVVASKGKATPTSKSSNGKAPKTPITAGQSIGKLARSAKIAAAPAAE